MASPPPDPLLLDAAARARTYGLGPSATYLTGEDYLRLTVLNAAAGVTVALRARVLALDGVVRSGESRLVPATDRTSSTIDLRLPEGWLLGAHARVVAGTPLTGQTFAILSLMRGEGATALDLDTLAAGYVTALQPCAWPAGSIANSLDGAGALRSISGTTPAAGAEISETVPTGARWNLLAFFATFVTSAAVANRQPGYTLDDGATVYVRTQAAVAQTASLTVRYQLAQSLNRLALDVGSNTDLALMSEAWLGAGFRIRSITGAIDVADQWSTVQYLVREFIEGA